MHFAYPNVIPKDSTFIGCGRYRVLNSLEDNTEGYHLIDTSPNTPNRLSLEHAMQVLGPEGYSSAGNIHEIRDQPEHKYQGDSLDLAYLLVHINRGRRLRFTPSKDIWCTGVVQVNEGKPILRKVDDTGFKLKLAAFLAPENKDPLFIVPAANLTSRISENIANNNAKIHTLGENVDAILRNLESPSKTVLQVLPHELPSLVDSLFSPFKKSRKIWRPLLGISLLTILGVGVWYLQSPINSPETTSEEQATELQRDEKAINAEKQIDRIEGTGTIQNETSQRVESKAIIPKIEAPLDATIRFIYRRRGSGEPMEIDISTLKPAELTLTHKDHYRLAIDIESIEELVYLYIYQFDSQGNMDCLHPNRALGNQNPVVSNGNPIKIPPQNKEWLFLSKLDDGMTGLIQEQIIVVLARSPNSEIEQLYDQSQLTNISNQQTINKMLEAVDRQSQRNDPSVTIYTMKFLHGS